MADGRDIDRDDARDAAWDDAEADDARAAARWALAIDEGLSDDEIAAFHAWIAERPDRAFLISRQAELQMLADALPRRAPGVTRRGITAIAATVAAAVFAGAAWLALAPRGGVAPETYATERGEVRAVELADASRLWLDARTRASVRLRPERRDVDLASGRLFVEVAHDPDRPFVVHGDGFEARAVGTAFEATVFDDRAGIAVAEGVVRVSATASGGVVELAAGESAWVSAAGEILTRTSPTADAAAWRERRMVLVDQRLDSALAELSRYFDRPLRVRDPRLAEKRLSLSFSIADLDAADAGALIAPAVNAEVVDLADLGLVLSPQEISPDAAGR